MDREVDSVETVVSLVTASDAVDTMAGLDHVRVMLQACTPIVCRMAQAQSRSCHVEATQRPTAWSSFGCT